MNKLDLATEIPNDTYLVALRRAIEESKKYFPQADFTDPDYGTAYVAGKMSGLPSFGFPAFDAAAHDLRGQGWLVLSPAEMDDEDERDHAMDSEDGKNSKSEYPRAHFLKRDYLIVCEVDVVVVLPNWKDSEGALGETLIAFSLNKPVLTYPNLEQLTWDDHPYSRHWSDIARQDLMAMRSD